MKKLFFAVFSAFAALALLISIGAYRTQAKELTSQVKISQVTTEGEKISYHWEIDGGVEVGDTFTISMPEDVKFASSAFSSMKNASGEEIATGKVSDDGKTLTITFVKGGNKGAEGNVSFWYKWDGDNTTGQDQERSIKIGSESAIVRRSGQGPVPVLLPIKKYNSGGTDNTNLQHAQKIWGPTGIPDWRDTLEVTDKTTDGFLFWHISVNNAVDKKEAASSIVFTDQMPNLPALDYSRIKSAKGQDVSQYFKGGTYLPASFDLKVNGKTFVVDGKPMSGLGLEPYIEWTDRGFKLDLTKVSDQFKVASTDEITLSYQTLLQHADQIKSVTNVASLTSDQHKTAVAKENTWVNKAASADAQVYNSDVTTSTTTTSTTTTTESTTSSTTTTTPESTTSSTTTTTPESTTSSTTTTTPESTTTTPESTTSSTTTTTEEPKTSTSTTTTTEEPTSQNSSEESSSTTTTTTESSTSETTAPTADTTAPTADTTASTSKTTTPEANGSTTTTTTGEPTTVSTTGDKPGLPNTGERNSLIVSVAGVAMLIVAVGTVLHYRKK